MTMTEKVWRVVASDEACFGRNQLHALFSFFFAWMELSEVSETRISWPIEARCLQLQEYSNCS
uniref:Uncharacterized protein n=1 Tax=Arundo donax TaxID=35708 RepID=A0A0A9FEZ8_ARUDO